MKRNSLIKRVAVGIMALSLVIPYVPARAQVSYDPTDKDINHDIYIDTSSVPKGTEDIQIQDDEIHVVRNVKFQLDCNVDASWTIVGVGAAAASTENQNNTDAVWIDPLNGLVNITAAASGGYYTVTATPENVEKVKPKTISIFVDSSVDPAKATSIKLDKGSIEDGEDIPGTDTKRVAVSGDNDNILTIKGRVINKELDVVIEPAYLFDDAVTFRGKNDDVYIVGDRDEDNCTDEYITSIATSKRTTLECVVGTGVTAKSVDFTLIVNNEDFKQDLITNDMTNSDEYNIKMNQFVSFFVDTNGNSANNIGTALPQYNINGIAWTFAQGNGNVDDNPVDVDEDEDDEPDYTRYKIRNVKGRQIGEIRLYPDNLNMDIITLSNGYEKNVDVDPIVIKGTANVTRVNVGGVNNTMPIDLAPKTVKFTTSDPAKFNKATLDFEKFGYTDGLEYREITETINKKDYKVYYFESGMVLPIADLTYADTDGVGDFEAAKDLRFMGDNAAYTVKYTLSDLNEFGSDDANALYNNDQLDPTNDNELNTQGTLKNNGQLTLQGKGYKKLTVACTKGEEEISKETYIIRVVTAVTDLNLPVIGLAIEKNDNANYNSLVETIHVRQGEAILPGIIAAGVTLPVTQDNPYIEYTFEKGKENIANAYVDANGRYRISGKTEGKVVVTATSKVNQSASCQFTLYVNKDIYESVMGYKLTFASAQAANKVNSADVVQGKYDEVPVDVVALDGNSGIPSMQWSLDCDESIATINDQGVITTKTSTASNGKITITAKYGSKTITKQFTIADIDGSGIDVIEEDVSNGKTAKVTPGTKNTGSCNVGDTFTLYPSSYIPEYATKLDGNVTWSSGNESIAIVSSKGEVTTVGPGTTEIIAEYQPKNGTDSKQTRYTLSVNGNIVPVTSIDAADVELSRINANAPIDAVVTPDNATDKRLKYVSSDASIATVDASGKVTAIDTGNCTIEISSVSNPDVKKIINVFVGGNADKTNNEKVNDAIAKINAIGTVTADDASKAKIDAARAAYNALTDAERANVSADVVALLTNAESAYTTAKAAADDAAKKAAEEAAAKKAAEDKAAADAAAAKAAADAAAQAAAAEAAAKNVGATKISSAKNSKAKKIVVKLKAVTGANGYQVRYSLKKNMKKATTKTITKNSITLSKLKKGKTYYIQARSYATYNGNTYYSKWTTAKKVKVKK